MEKGNWFDKYKTAPAVDNEDAEKTLLSNWDSTTQQFEELRSGYEGLGSRYEELSAMESRTPEQEKDLQDTWNKYVRSGLEVQSALKNVETLQPEVESFNNRQKQKRVDYIESQRGSAVFGNEVADSLYDIDARADLDYEKARGIPDKDKRKEAFAKIKATYQTEETQLLQSRIDAFKENETKIANAAEVIGQAFSTQGGDRSSQTVDQFLLETSADVAEYAELRDSLLNQDDPEKGKLFKEASLMYKLAEGTASTGVVNGEVRISPSAVWNAESVKREIAELDVSDAQKQLAIANIPRMQEEAAKLELPFLQKVKEFNAFVKANNLQGDSPKDQISEWKSRTRNWSEMITKAPAQVGIGLTQGALGLLEAGQAIVGGTAMTLGAQKFADPFLDAATQTSERNQELGRISREIGGPTLLAELAAVAPQIALQIGVGKTVSFGGNKLGLKPKTVSNLGFGSSVGTAMAQSYGGVFSSAFQQLEKEKIDGGMDPIQARAEAVKEAQLPAALSGLSTAIVTAIGGKRGVESPFNEGVDGIRAKLNTAAFRAELPRLIPDVVKGMRNEGYEELADQLAQGIVEQFTFNPELKTSDIINNAAKALLIGGITGGTVEGMKYGFDYMNAPKAMARREASMASIRQSITDVEREISDVSASSPIGGEFQREYDATLPSDEAARLGGVAVDRTKMVSLQAERQELSELLEDDTISKVARNQLEGKLAAADFEYYNEVLAPMRRNVVNEQLVDQLDGMAVSQQTKDGIVALSKIANGLGADSLTGRERVAVGITAIGDGKFLASKKNPMVEVGDSGATVTEAGRLMAENVGMVPLVRMIGLSESTIAKQAEMERIVNELAEKKAQQEAKDTAESEEAKRYGPTSAEALKQQVAAQPPAPETEPNVRLAQLIKDQEEAARKALEALKKPETPTVEEPPVVPELEPLRRVTRAEQTPEDVTALTETGLIEIYKDQPVLTQAGIDALPETERPRLNPEARKIQIDTGSNEVVAEAISKGLRIGVDQVGSNVTMPQGWTLDGDIYVPPAKPVEPPIAPPTEPPVAPPITVLTEPIPTLPENWTTLTIQNKASWLSEQVAGTVVGSAAAEGKANDIDILVDETKAIDAVAKMQQLGYEAAGESLVSPEEAKRAGKDFGGEWARARRMLRYENGILVDQVDIWSPDTTPEVTTTAKAITEEQANNVVNTAQKERAKKTAPTIGRSRWGPQSIPPKTIIGGTAREALMAASRLNLSKIAQSSPNEIVMQDVAAILAELKMPILDLESVATLSSLRAKGRPRRWPGIGSVIGMPSTIPMPVEVLVHEVGHTLTADQIRRYLPRKKTGSGKAYFDALNKAIADPKTPEAVGRLFSLYVSAIDQLGITEQYFGAKGVAGTPKADTSKAMAKRLQAQGLLRKDLKGSDLYGLANVEEFVSQTFSEPSFRNILKGLKDPTNSTQSLWQAFVDAIQSILQLPKGSMAAGVIETSIDVGMTVPSDREVGAGRGQPSPATEAEADMGPEAEPEEGTEIVGMELKQNKERMNKIFAERMYVSNLPDVVAKETIQNAFDGIKDAEAIGEIPQGSGVILYSQKDVVVDGEERVRVAFIDNGVGMTPEILQKAFFTVGGTFKRSEKASGGFGIAKLGMFMSAKNVFVETVRDGVVTTANVVREDLMTEGKTFNVVVKKNTQRKNGTMVVLEFDKVFTKTDGSIVEYDKSYTSFDELIYHDLTIYDDTKDYNRSDRGKNMDIFMDYFRGNATIEDIDAAIGYSSRGERLITFDALQKELPEVEIFEKEIPVANAQKPIKVRILTSRFGLKDEKGDRKYYYNKRIGGISGVFKMLVNASMNVYSNGLFQFNEGEIKLDPDDDSKGILPYGIFVDIDAAGLDAARVEYPFTNNREDLRNGPVDDFINKTIFKIRRKEIERQFDQTFSAVTDFDGNEPSKDKPVIYNNTTLDLSSDEFNFVKDLSIEVFNLAETVVQDLRRGHEEGFLDDPWYRVKTRNLPPEKQRPDKPDEDTLDYFYGVGLSKNWSGVNTSREPVSALVNPVYDPNVYKWLKTPEGRNYFAMDILKTLIHEINHHIHRNEGSSFTYGLAANEGYLTVNDKMRLASERILPIIEKYSDTILSLKTKFDDAKVKDAENELSGGKREKPLSESDQRPYTSIVGGERIVQEPSADVPRRPASGSYGQKTGTYAPSSLQPEQRRDIEAGKGIPFGEVVAKAATDTGAVITEEGFVAGENLAPDEEFDIVPEQVEDQIEGTPEASTMKVMGQAFQMADEQSAANGTPEGTLPMETIVGAWMNSGFDVDTLENAIIRYTNLGPEVAETLAEAIGKQREIQRGIMDIADAAQSRKAQEDEEPEIKPYSFAERIKGDLPPVLRNKIQLVYEVLRNEVSVQEANQAMSGLTVDEAIEATKDEKNGIRMPVRSMMAQIVLRKIMAQRKATKGKKGREADYEAAVEAHVDFFNWTSEYFKELGQGVQAIARFSDLGADGVLLKVRKSVDKAMKKHITNRRGQIDKIKRDVEEADSAAFKAALNANKGSMDATADKAGNQEAKMVTIEEQAQTLAQRAAKKVAGEEVRRRQPDPLSELVNGHLRRYNANFIAEATAMGVSPVTAQAIEDSAIKLRDSRKSAKAERERFKDMQDERIKVKKELARENKYIYGERPTIWEDYQEMFSERLARRLMRDPKKKVPPSLLLFTDRLTENLLGFVPEAKRQATTQRSFQAMIEDALNNKEKYQEAFSKAMEDISLKVMELEARAGGGEAVSSAAYKKALAAQEFMERLEPIIQQFPVSDKLIIRFVNQKTKAIGESITAKYNQWGRSSKKTRSEIEMELAEKLVEDIKISDSDAIKLSRAIIKDFRAKAEERREKALARFRKPKEKTKRLKDSPLKTFFELVNIGAMTDEDAYAIMAHRFELPTWDAKFAKQIEEMATIVQDMPEGLERRRLTRNMMAEIARKKGFSLSDLGAGFAYSNMLSSVETFLINLQDTLFNNWFNGFASAAADRDFTRMRGLLAGYRKGWQEAIQVFQTGLRINMPRLEEKTPLTVELINYGKKGGVALESTEGMNAIAKTLLESPPAKLLNAWKYVTRIMEATDALNYVASSEGQRYAEAAKMANDEGLEGKEKTKRINQILNLGDDVYQAALKQAESEGYTGTDMKFRAMEIQDSKIDADLREKSFDRALVDVYRSMPTGLSGFFAAKFNGLVMAFPNAFIRNAFKILIAPFVITPTNVFNRWLDWSPYGYKRLFLGSGNLTDKDGPYYVAPPKVGSAEFWAQTYKASSSVLVFLMAEGLIRAGLLVVNGMGPSDEEERKQWLADGNRPHTFSFMGGPQISYQYTPWALVLSLRANYDNWAKYQAKEDASLVDRGLVGLLSATSVIMDLPFFAGPADFLDFVQSKTSGDASDSVSKYVEGKMGVVFPNFLRHIDRIFDPTLYDSRGIKGIILDQTPFARRLGTQKVNLFGDPIGEDKPTMDRLIGRIVSSPVKPSRESLILAKYDIYPYMPTPQRAKALVDGVEAQMTEEQYNKFVKIVGGQAKREINSLFDPEGEVSETEMKLGKKRISQIFEKARARGVREVSY
jgi:hypothetical protein